MCGPERRCTGWISLESMGVAIQGCMRSPQWLKVLVIPSHHSPIRPLVYFDTPHETLTCIRTVSHGAFGYIDLGTYRQRDVIEDVYIKRPIHPGKSLLYEACMQSLVHSCLADIGFPNGAPAVKRIFRLKDQSVGFAMEPIEGACTLDHYLESVPSSCFANAMVECLLQLCAMIWHLNSRIGINHRDLTPSNFMVVDHAPVRKVLTIDTILLEISSTRSLTLIDFGFSCLGSIETQRADISLSTVYPSSDPCPKEGRDLYLFIGHIYIDYYDKLPIQLLRLFEAWLEEPGVKLCKTMKDKESSKRWLYFMVGDDRIKRFPTYPLKIVQDLQAYLSL